MICDQWDVVVVPFPFTDKPVAKRRPALVLSHESFNRSGHAILAMITSKSHRPWPDDAVIEDLASAGLSVSCIVRLKLFTLDNRLILEQKGTLAANDSERVTEALNSALG